MSNIYPKLYNYGVKSDGKSLWTPPSFKDFVKDQFAKIM
jgi:hypothetical protein